MSFVDAETVDDAISKVEDMYFREAVILSKDNYKELRNAYDDMEKLQSTKI